MRKLKVVGNFPLWIVIEVTGGQAYICNWLCNFMAISNENNVSTWEFTYNRSLPTWAPEIQLWEGEGQAACPQKNVSGLDTPARGGREARVALGKPSDQRSVLSPAWSTPQDHRAVPPLTMVAAPWKSAAVGWWLWTTRQDPGKGLLRDASEWHTTLSTGGREDTDLPASPATGYTEFYGTTTFTFHAWHDEKTKVKFYLAL